MRPAVSQILAFTFLYFAAVSCKKSDTVTVTPLKSKTILLTQASWKIKSIALDADRNGVADQGGDLTASIQGCQLDNTYRFKTDSTGIMDEAALKCDASDPQTKPFTWLFTNNETVLHGTFGFSDDDASIISMNDTSLVITYDDNFGTTTSYHIIATLQH